MRSSMLSVFLVGSVSFMFVSTLGACSGDPNSGPEAGDGSGGGDGGDGAMDGSPVDGDNGIDPEDTYDDTLSDTTPPDDGMDGTSNDTGAMDSDMPPDSDVAMDSGGTMDSSGATDAVTGGMDGSSNDVMDIADSGSSGGDADTGLSDSSPDSTDVSDTMDTGPNTRRPSLIYVDSKDRLSYLDSNMNIFRPGPSGDIRAIGPSLFYDSDNVREIPYAIADGTGGFSLKIVDLNGAKKTLDKNIMGYVNYGRLGVADVNNNSRLDIVYPNDNKALNYIDPTTGTTKIVKVGNNGNNAKPAAYMGGIDKDSDGNEELYWLGTSSNVKYVTQTNLKKIQFPSSGFHIGANNNFGVGAPRDVNNNGSYTWGQIDGSNNPGLVPESGGAFSALNKNGVCAKVPMGFADITQNSRQEAVVVDTNGKLRYVTTKNPGTSGKLKYLKAGGSKISTRKKVGVVSGYTAFRDRIQ